MNTREQQVRTWSMLCHLSALAVLIFPFGNIFGPLIVWQIKKNDLPEIDPHGKESLNFQITVLIITLVFSVFLFFILTEKLMSFFAKKTQLSGLTDS